MRDKIDDLADHYGIAGYVENRPKKEFFILAQGVKENLDQFCQSIQRLERPTKVDSLRITEHPVDERYHDFSIVRGDPNEELAERFDTAIFYLHSIDNKQDSMLNKQDTILEKQDQMIGKQDQMITLQKESICLQSKTLDEVHALRSDFTERVMAEVTLARTEIRELRNELIQAGVLNEGRS